MEDEKINVMLISPNKNINKVELPCKEHKLIVKEGKIEPKFKPESIFYYKEKSNIPILGPFIDKFKKREPTILQVYGKNKAEVLRGTSEEGEDLGLFSGLTEEEMTDLVQNKIAKAMGEAKPMSPMMFYILSGLSITIIFLLVMILAGVRLA